MSALDEIEAKREERLRAEREKLETNLAILDQLETLQIEIKTMRQTQQELMVQEATLITSLKDARGETEKLQKATKSYASRLSSQMDDSKESIKRWVIFTIALIVLSMSANAYWTSQKAGNLWHKLDAIQLMQHSSN